MKYMTADQYRTRRMGRARTTVRLTKGEIAALTNMIDEYLKAHDPEFEPEYQADHDYYGVIREVLNARSTS
jgi:hypothetical protein